MVRSRHDTKTLIFWRSWCFCFCGRAYTKAEDLFSPGNENKLRDNTCVVLSCMLALFVSVSKNNERAYTSTLEQHLCRGVRTVTILTLCSEDSTEKKTRASGLMEHPEGLDAFVFDLLTHDSRENIARLLIRHSESSE